MLSVVTYWWGHKYAPYYVERLAFGVHRFMQQKHRFVCVTDTDRRPIPGVEFIRMPEEDLKWTKIQGCFARMRLFDPEWQKKHHFDDRILSLDLDLIVVNSMDSIADREEPFLILQGINTANLCPFNGSVFMLRKGALPQLWSDLTDEVIATIPRHEFPDDQGWMHFKLGGAAAYGPSDGIYGFKKKGWPAGDGLPLGAKIVCFPGWRDPEKFQATVPWIAKYWRA